MGNFEKFVALMILVAIVGFVFLIATLMKIEGQKTICREISWQSKKCLEIRKQILEN